MPGKRAPIGCSPSPFGEASGYWIARLDRPMTGIACGEVAAHVDTPNLSRDFHDLASAIPGCREIWQGSFTGPLVRATISRCIGAARQRVTANSLRQRG